MLFKLRTTCEDLSSDLFSSLTHDADYYLVSKEVGSVEFKAHYHWYINTNVEDSTLRARIRKFGLKGNGGYSLSKLKGSTEMDVIEYIAYITKEGDYKTNLPSDVIRCAIEYDTKVKEDIKATKAEKKNTLTKLIEYINEKKPELLPSLDKDHQDLDVNSFDIARLIVDYHVEHDLLIRKFQIQAYLHTIVCKYSHWGKTKFIQDLF